MRLLIVGACSLFCLSGCSSIYESVPLNDPHGTLHVLKEPGIAMKIDTCFLGGMFMFTGDWVGNRPLTAAQGSTTVRVSPGVHNLYVEWVGEGGVAQARAKLHVEEGKEHTLVLSRDINSNRVFIEDKPCGSITDTGGRDALGVIPWWYSVSPHPGHKDDPDVSPN